MQGIMVSGDWGAWAVSTGAVCLVLGGVFVGLIAWRYEARERIQLPPHPPEGSELAQQVVQQVEDDRAFRQIIRDEYGDDPHLR